MNTFVLAWIVEEITGLPFQDVLTREVWWHIGAESNASYIAPRCATAFPSRTVASWHACVTWHAWACCSRRATRWSVTTRSFSTSTYIEFLWSAGRPELLVNAGMPETSISGVKHNIYQWDSIHVNGDYYKGGWAGQGFLVNPQRDVVAVWTGYMKDDESSEVYIEPVIREVLDGVFTAGDDDG